MSTFADDVFLFCVCLQLVSECRSLVQHADSVHSRLVEAQQAVMEWHEELQPIAMQAGLKGKKLNKVMKKTNMVP